MHAEESVEAAMKVALLSSLFSPHTYGGAEKVVEALASGLSGRGADVIVFSLSPRPMATRQDDIDARYVRLRNIYWPFGTAANPTVVKPLWHLVDSFNPAMSAALEKTMAGSTFDICHTHNLAGFSVAAWRVMSKRAPIVHTLHDYYLLCPRSTMFRKDAPCERQCRDCAAYSIPRKRASGLVQTVTGVSRFVLDRHVDNGYFARAGLTRVVRNPALGEPASTTLSTRRVLRVGYLGRLHPTKGIEVLLRAAGNVDCEVWVAGAGEPGYETELRQKAPANVTFRGSVNASEFLDEIDALIVPSLWWENAPMVIYEAYGRSVPIIGARRGGIPEMVEDGASGFLFDPDSPDELHELLAKLAAYRDPLVRMRERAGELSARYELDKILDEYTDVYEQTLAGSRRSA